MLRFDPEFMRSFGLFTAAGVQLLLLSVGLLWVGSKLDVYFGFSPVFLLLGLFGGFGAGIYNLVRILNSEARRKGEQK